jgi:hypothetical protein
MHRRTRTTLLIFGLVLLLLAAAVYLRKQAPPEAARLLPESDGIVYINLRPIRLATHFEQRPVAHDADYQKFVDATGIQFERDLDEAAFALHRMTPATGPNGAVGFSTVFVGRFDGKRLSNYLAGAAASTEDYEGHTIYSIPVEGRTDRVAMLGYDIAAVSNMPTTEQIHSILDRYRSAALPFSGSSLLSEHYPEIPLLSLAWGVGKIGLPLRGGRGEGGDDGLKVLGMTIPVPANATFLASVRWAGSLHLRVEEIAADEASAGSASDSLNAMLGLLKAAVDSDPSISSDARNMVKSVSIQHRRDRATLTATIPTSLLERLTEDARIDQPAPAPPAGQPAH